MAECIGCGRDTNMERAAEDAPDDSADRFLKTRANEGQRASGYVPLCPTCSQDWDKDTAKRGSVSDQGTLSAPPHSAEQNTRPAQSNPPVGDKDKK